MKIYAVFGFTGEYSDHSAWPVKAFKAENGAQDFCLEANKIAKGVEKLESCLREDFEHSLDPNFECDYTGTYYDYYEIELL